MIAFAYLLGLARVFTILAALDTGSSFEGMGASREAAFSAFAEPALFLAVAVFCIPAGGASFSAAFAALPWSSWGAAHPEILIAVVVIFAVLLAENARIPVDDPATHLELTMIHEAMVLEYSGADLALVEWASALKELLFMTILVNLFLPLGIAMSAAPAALSLSAAAYASKVFLLAVAVATVEVTNAKLRFFRVPELMALSLGLGFLALALRFL